MLLDHPLLTSRLFFPRSQPVADPVRVDVGGAVLACHGTVVDPGARTLLYFHGNGEVVADYLPELALAVGTLGLNLVIAEYRGYGGSTGSPCISSMLTDAEIVLHATGVPANRTIVFGRSLGSICAIELAGRHPDLAGVVIESGIADPLERVLARVSPEELGVSPKEIQVAVVAHLDHRAKLGRYAGPLLVLHTEEDGILDISHARRNHAWAASTRKELIVFPRGNHNSIQLVNHAAYWAAMRRFVEGLDRNGGSHP